MKRFWLKTKDINGCLVWQASRQTNGYGQFSYKGKNRRAHRVAYELTHGTIPEGMCVCHSCDNPLCVNPDHLWLGTQAENLRDMRAKKRANDPCLKGSAAGNVKLTEDDVENIRANRMNLKQTELATLYGVTQSSISNIQSRKSWTHI